MVGSRLIVSTTRHYYFCRRTEEKGGVEVEGRNSKGDIRIAVASVRMELSSDPKALSFEEDSWERIYRISNLSFLFPSKADEKDYIRSYLLNSQ